MKKQKHVRKQTPWRGLILIWGLAMLALLAWSFWPAGRKSITLPFESLTTPGGNVIELPGRVLRIEWPGYLRVGEVGLVTMEITPGKQPEDVLLTVAARLAMASQAGETAESGSVLRDGQPARFSWEVNAEEAGVRQGLLWLSVWVEKEGLPAEEVAVLARPVEIPIRSFLAWRILAGIGLLAGAGAAIAVWRMDRG